MGITKTAGFTPQVTDMAFVLKALGHPGRLAIIEFLAQSTSCICGDIVNEIPLAQPTISKHLTELKRVGLIEGSIEGKTICYCVNTERWNQVKQWINSLSAQLEDLNKCC